MKVQAHGDRRLDTECEIEPRVDQSPSLTQGFRCQTKSKSHAIVILQKPPVAAQAGPNNNDGGNMFSEREGELQQNTPDRLMEPLLPYGIYVCLKVREGGDNRH